MKSAYPIRSALLGVLTALVLLGPVAGARTVVNLRAEIRVAGIHAGLAVDMHRVALIHLHLHHVINCLVGVQGRPFDPQAGNPCKGLGHGAIPDAPANGNVHLDLVHALHLALSGEKAATYPLAHRLALGARHFLLLAKDALAHG
ncbi:secreted protein [mine drainage metagenome]|uniref:Secreted protein n=1 Tax=mine drainage metagenome TaxID=410659 RepID=T1A8U7_9ZZZZ